MELTAETSGPSAGCAADLRLGFEQRQDALGDRKPVGARMELRPELSEGQVQLGREHQHRQPGLEPEAAVVEADADRHRDQRHPDRGRELSSTDPMRNPTRNVAIVARR